MKIGLFTAMFLDTKLEDVCTMAADLGHQAVELPAFAGNPQLIDSKSYPSCKHASKNVSL